MERAADVFQLAFGIDRVKALAPQHPEWKENEPFKSVLAGDLKGLAAGGEHALLELVLATHTGNTTEEFEQIVRDWIATAKHPKTGRLYKAMVFQPMLELLDYLRANSFNEEAGIKGWTIVAMQNDWIRVFPPTPFE